MSETLNLFLDEKSGAGQPQQRGAWHMHVLLKSDNETLYIANEKMAELWGHGFTKTTAIQNIDNIGAYLSAYLSNLPEDNNADSTSKKAIKGARLYYYPIGFNFYRHSKDMKMPEIIKGMPFNVAMQKVDGHALTFTYETSIDKDGFQCDIKKWFYNAKRKDQ